MLRLAVVDQADLGGGAAHVERQDLVEAALARQRRRQDGAAGRARFDQPDRELARGLERGEAAARGDHEEGTADALLAQRLVEAAEIAVHHRLDVGVGHAVDQRSYSRISGDTSLDSVIDTPGSSSLRISRVRRSCLPSR